MSYNSEKELLNVAISSCFMKSLINSDNSHHLIEPKRLFGIPDLLILNFDGEGNNKSSVTSIAFEMKLSNWKRALCQAFKYRAFANISYVIMDYDHANPALKNIDKFRKSNIGLLSIDDEGFVHTHFEPSADEPYHDGYYNVILDYLNET